MRLMIKQWLVAMAAFSVPAVALAQTTAPAISREEQLGNAALAEHLAQLAQLSLSSRSIVPATLRQSATLLEEACRLNPTEPRFPKLAAEAHLQLSQLLAKHGESIDETRADLLAALLRYLALVPGDQPTQIRIIDLLYAGKEAGDAKVDYATKVLATESFAAEVRAHAAILLAEVSDERGEKEKSNDFIDTALKLFPLSPEALRLKYRTLPTSAPDSQQAALLVALLRSNPTQPGVMANLAQLLADNGLVDPALQWFTNSITLQTRQNAVPNIDMYVNYLAEMVIADQLAAAEGLVGKVLEQDAGNYNAAMLNVLIAKRNGDVDKLQAAVDVSRKALMQRLGAVSDVLNKREATTQPSTDFDLAADVKALLEKKSPTAIDAYASGLADLAWLDIYFRAKPADAQANLALLEQLVPADSLVLARLQGWSYLIDGKNDEAKVKLSAIADSDPLAQLGMIKLDSATASADQSRQAVRKLLEDNASGTMGAILIEALRDKVGLMPAGPHAAEVRAELDKLPKDWLDLTDPANVRKYYAVKAEPLKVAHMLGEPMLARITIGNTSTYDLTVGADGLIHPDIWVDCQAKGLSPQYFSGVAIDQLGGKLVLKPKDSISQVVRIDQYDLAKYLRSNPAAAIHLYFNMLTNPMTGSGGVAPGPGGYRIQFSMVVERAATPMATMGSTMKDLQLGEADKRFRTVDLLGVFAAAMKKATDEKIAGQAVQLVDLIRKSTGDSSLPVRAEAMASTAALSDAAVRLGVLKQMLADDSPTMRIVGLTSVQELLDPADRKPLADPLAASDPDPLVKKLAATVSQVADMPAATQPATQESPNSTATGGQ